jgi:hypothetical protein
MENGFKQRRVLIKRRFVMARKTIRNNEHEQKTERELTPDEIADLLTGGCDNQGMS